MAGHVNCTVDCLGSLSSQVVFCFRPRRSSSWPTAFGSIAKFNSRFPVPVLALWCATGRSCRSPASCPSGGAGAPGFTADYSRPLTLPTRRNYSAGHTTCAFRFINHPFSQALLGGTFAAHIFGRVTGFGLFIKVLVPCYLQVHSNPFVPQTQGLSIQLCKVLYIYKKQKSQDVGLTFLVLSHEAASAPATIRKRHPARIELVLDLRSWWLLWNWLHVVWNRLSVRHHVGRYAH
jgi:hypothetical protein